MHSAGLVLWIIDGVHQNRDRTDRGAILVTVGCVLGVFGLG